MRNVLKAVTTVWVSKTKQNLYFSLKIALVFWAHKGNGYMD